MSDLHSPDPDSLLTAEQVAHLLGVTPAWVYAQSRSGGIPTVTLGRYRRYRREAIDAWVCRMEEGGRAPGQARSRPRVW